MLDLCSQGHVITATNLGMTCIIKSVTRCAAMAETRPYRMYNHPMIMPMLELDTTNGIKRLKPYH